MADINRLARLINGVTRGIDLSSNTLVMSSLKLSSTELTRVILDKLILINNVADADGSFDTRYYTQTQVDDLLGDQSDASNITYTPNTLADWNGSADPGETNNALDQLASRTKTSEGTISTHIANVLNPHVVTKAQVLSGDLIVNADIAVAAGIDFSKMAVLTAGKAVYTDGSGIIRTLDSVTDTELGYLTGTSSNIQAQLNALNSGYNRRKKATDYIVDNTIVPPTEVSGDRYVLSHDGGVPHVNYDGASAGDIVEFDGANWISTTPEEGWVLYMDSENKDYLYVDDGTGQWEPRNVQSVALSDGKIWVGNSSNESVEVTVSGDISISNAGVAAITAGSIVNADINATAGIVESKLTLDYSTTSLNSAITTHAGLTDNPHSVTKAQVLSGDPIVNADISASAGIETSKMADATKLQEAIDFHTGSDISAAEAETLTDGSNADSLHTHGANNFLRVAGVAFAANVTHAVRVALDGETAGRVYPADYDASVDNEFYAIGLITPTTSISAGDTVIVTVFGEHTLGASDAVFDSAEIGEPVHIKSNGEWDAVSQITYANDQASYRIGMILDVNKILLTGAQLLGIY